MRKKLITCQAGQWTKIIDNFGSGWPRGFTVTITNPTGGPVVGEYMEKRYFWIIPEQPITGQLQPTMQFQRYWINGIYSVALKPEQLVVAEVC